MENSNDTFTEVSNQSWGSRIMESIKSVLFGVVLFLGAFIVLWYNEGRVVKTAKALNEAQDIVVPVSSDQIDPANDQQLVHLSGKVSSTEVLTDPTFGVSANCIKLQRKVLMYQWKETKKTKTEKKTGGGEKKTTTYSYSKVWSEKRISSDEFKKQEKHINPTSFRYRSRTSQVANAKIGAFDLPQALLSRVSNYQNYNLKNSKKIKLGKDVKLISNADVPLIYIGKGSIDNPKIGDMKVIFQMVPSGIDYSIIAKQVNTSFEPFITSNDREIEMITSGIASSDKMFASAHTSNNLLKWILRIVGFGMMFIGLNMVLSPLVVVADVLPILGNIIGMGAALVAGVISFACSFITISIAWIFYRPILGISLLLIGLGAFFLFAKKVKKK